MQVWKTVRIFISSTFRDMHAERDFLVRFVFPELRERCAKRNLHLIDVDLRWGVTEEEAKQGKVIEICFDEIERCRPFFIGLLGERYGWTPEKFEVSDDEKFEWLNEYRGHSVTALEIYHGVLRDEEMTVRAFFYFREADFLKDVPHENRADFLPESDDAVEKLRALKEEIITKCSVFENYPCAYDGIDEKGKVKLADLEEEFGKRVLEDLWMAICLEHPEDETPPDDLAIERTFHETFIENRTERFVGRRDVLDKLHEFADGESENSLVVTGVAGCGKSAVLAKFTKEYAEKHAEDFVLTHFIGVSPGSTDVRRTLLRLCRELKRKFDIQEEIPTDYYELRQAFVKFLEQAAERGKVLLVIDALNQLDAQHFAHHLDWLPSPLPKGTKIIVSTLEGDCLDALRRRSPQPLEIVVGALAEVERKEIVRQTLETYRKTLDEKQMRLLLAKKESDNPLFLIVACEEMRVYGDFESVSDKLESLAEQVETLFGQVLERVEHDHSTELVTDALVLLECSRHGLLESEMLELLTRDGEAQLPQAIWARFYRSIQFYLRPPGESGEGLLDFFHRQLAKAVRNRYLTNEETEIAAHQRLAQYFQRKADSSNDKTWTGNYPRGLSELAHHQLAGKLYDDLFQTARDETFLTKQSEAFADDPELQLQTLQNAITGAAEIDDAAKMAEFVLSHARKVQSMRDESPLDALRKGNVERALKLADLYEIERCILWYLLIAWELKDNGRKKDSYSTLEQLNKKNMVKLSYWEVRIASVGLSFLADINESLINSLQSHLFDDNGKKELCEQLIKRQNYSAAKLIALGLSNVYSQSELLAKISEVQIESESLDEALLTINQINDDVSKNRAQIKIVTAFVKKGDFETAIQQTQTLNGKFQVEGFCEIASAQFQFGLQIEAKTTCKKGVEVAQLIKFQDHKYEALLKIAKVQSKIQCFADAIKTAQLIVSFDYHCFALCEIAALQGLRKNFRAARKLIVSALKTTQKINNNKIKMADCLREIAKTQAKFGRKEEAKALFVSALNEAKSIEVERERVLKIEEILISQSRIGLIEEALENLNSTDGISYITRNGILQRIAKSAIFLSDFESALKIAKLIDKNLSGSKERANILCDIAFAQAREGFIEDAKKNFIVAFDDAKYIGKGPIFEQGSMYSTPIEQQKIDILGRIASAQIQNADNENAEKTIELISIHNSQVKPKIADCSQVLSDIAFSYAKTGNLKDAFETAYLIDDVSAYCNALFEISKLFLFSNGNTVIRNISAFTLQTEDTLKLQSRKDSLGIENAQKARILLEIASVQGTLRENETAKKILKRAFETAKVAENGANIELIKEIAISQSRFNDADGAVQTSQKIKHDNTRHRLFLDVIRAQILNAEFETALKLAKSENLPIELRGSALCEIGLAQIEVGALNDALGSFNDARNNAKILEERAKNYFAADMRQITQIEAKQLRRLIGKTLVKAELFDEAIEEALTLTGFEKIKLICSVFVNQHRVGEKDAAISTIKLANELADEITTELDNEITSKWEQTKSFCEQGESFCEIAMALAKTDGISESKLLIEKAEEVKNNLEINDSTSLSAMIAKAQIEIGEKNLAFQTAFAVTINSLRDEVFEKIALAFIEKDDLKEASEAAFNINNWQNHSLYSPYGDRFAYWSSVAKHDDIYNKIAIFRAQKGDFVFALGTINNNISDQVKPLLEISKIFMGVPDKKPIIEEFRSTISRFKNEAMNKNPFTDGQSPILSILATTQAQLGDFEDAIQTATSIYHQDTKAKTFYEIALLQAKNGYQAESLKLLLSIEVEKFKYLSQFAATSSEILNKEYFKQLLLPCSFDLDSTYKIIGSLARFYSEQSSSIADLISNDKITNKAQVLFPNEQMDELQAIADSSKFLESANFQSKQLSDNIQEKEKKSNIKYQQELAQWKSISWWKRLWTKKPDPPKGI